MNVSEVVSLAQDSELKQLGIKNEPGTVRGYLNLGILELHKRFALIQQKALVTMVEGVNEYTLSVTDPNVEMNLKGNQYLTVDEVYNEEGDIITLENKKDPLTIKMPSYNTLEIPDDLLVPNEKLHIFYRAAPSFLTSSEDIVPLPAQFLEPLLHYIGYRGHASLHGGKQFENNTHYNRFDKSCAQIKALGLFVDGSLDSDKFINSGFV